MPRGLASNVLTSQIFSIVVVVVVVVAAAAAADSCPLRAEKCFSGAGAADRLKVGESD